MLCRFVLTVLVLAYLFALLLFAAGTFGWFGVEQDPLSSVFLILLGMPWVLLPFDSLVSEALLPFASVVAPLINLAIIWWLCRWRSRRRNV